MVKGDPLHWYPTYPVCPFADILDSVCTESRPIQINGLPRQDLCMNFLKEMKAPIPDWFDQRTIDEHEYGHECMTKEVSSDSDTLLSEVEYEEDLACWRTGTLKAFEGHMDASNVDQEKKSDKDSWTWHCTVKLKETSGQPTHVRNTQIVFTKDYIQPTMLS